MRSIHDEAIPKPVTALDGLPRIRLTSITVSASAKFRFESHPVR